MPPDLWERSFAFAERMDDGTRIVVSPFSPPGTVYVIACIDCRPEVYGFRGEAA